MALGCQGACLALSRDIWVPAPCCEVMRCWAGVWLSLECFAPLMSLAGYGSVQVGSAGGIVTWCGVTCTGAVSSALPRPVPARPALQRAVSSSSAIEHSCSVMGRKWCAQPRPGCGMLRPFKAQPFFSGLKAGVKGGMELAAVSHYP